MSKCPELVNTKKKGGSDLDQPRAVNSNGKVILTVCLSICMCVRASKSVHDCLPACLTVTGRGYSISFYKLITVPLSPGSISVFVCLSVCQPLHPMSWSATNLLSSLLKIKFVSKNNFTNFKYA